MNIGEIGINVHSECMGLEPCVQGDVKCALKRTGQRVLNLTKSISDLVEARNELDNQLPRDRALLTKPAATWIGYFVTFIHTPGEEKSKITRFFCWIFPSVKTVVGELDKLHKEIENKETYRGQLITFESLRSRELASAYEAYDKNMWQLQVKDAEQKIMDIFGGQEEFEKLPVLDISQKEQGDYLTCIRLDDLTAPIMRGRDLSGRLFITIKVIQDDGTRLHETYHSRYSDKGQWASAGSDKILGLVASIIKFSSQRVLGQNYFQHSLDYSYPTICTEGYTSLMNLIQNKEIERRNTRGQLVKFHLDEMQ